MAEHSERGERRREGREETEAGGRACGLEGKTGFYLEAGGSPEGL